MTTGNYEWLEGYFKDQDVCVVAAGPSVNEIDLERIKPLKKVVTSYMINLVDPDILVAIDGHTMPPLRQVLRDRFKADDFPVAPFKSVFCWTMPYDPGGQVATVRAQRAGEKVSITPPHMYSGLSTGLLALSTALHAGARRVFLLGCDCMPTDKVNCFDTKKIKGSCPSLDEAKKNYKNMAPPFEKYGQWASRIYNVSEISLIQSYKRLTPDEFYEMVGV